MRLYTIGSSFWSCVSHSKLNRVSMILPVQPWESIVSYAQSIHPSFVTANAEYPAGPSHTVRPTGQVRHSS